MQDPQNRFQDAHLDDWPARQWPCPRQSAFSLKRLAAAMKETDRSVPFQALLPEPYAHWFHRCQRSSLRHGAEFCLPAIPVKDDSRKKGYSLDRFGGWAGDNSGWERAADVAIAKPS